MQRELCDGGAIQQVLLICILAAECRSGRMHVCAAWKVRAVRWDPYSAYDLAGREVTVRRCGTQNCYREDVDDACVIVKCIHVVFL